MYTKLDMSLNFVNFWTSIKKNANNLMRAGLMYSIAEISSITNIYNIDINTSISINNSIDKNDLDKYFKKNEKD